MAEKDVSGQFYVKRKLMKIKKNKTHKNYRSSFGQKFFTISVELFNYELRLFYFSPYIMLQICDPSLPRISTLNHSYIINSLVYHVYLS